MDWSEGTSPDTERGVFDIWSLAASLEVAFKPISVDARRKMTTAKT